MQQTHLLHSQAGLTDAMLTDVLYPPATAVPPATTPPEAHQFGQSGGPSSCPWGCSTQYCSLACRDEDFQQSHCLLCTGEVAGKPSVFGLRCARMRWVKRADSLRPLRRVCCAHASEHRREGRPKPLAARSE